MTPVINIHDIAQHVGQTVTLRGWVYNKTGKGKLHFVQLRDGSGIVQCVAFQKDMSEADFEAVKSLTQESSLTIIGTVRAEERARASTAGMKWASTKWWCIKFRVNIPSPLKSMGWIS
jgi:asparaginyl-tRNA synthetase